MRGFLLACISLFAVASFLLPASFVIAEIETCDCWCKDSSGAQQVGDIATNADCRTSCAGAGYGYLACYSDASTPADNDKCWSQYECENAVAEVDGEEIPYEWDTTQAPDCINGEHYCYRPAELVDLNVVIGNLEEVDSLPDYINAAYNFLLPVAALLAVVMLMIAGLQYMLARGDAGRIGKAKDRIRNAVTGIILLLAAATMAEFIDPSLTNLNRLTPPAIRTVVFIDPDSTCEAMTVSGLTIEPNIAGQEDCGDLGTVADTGDVETTIQTGHECPYSGCANPYEVCASSSESETGYACLRCKEVYTTATDTIGATPSGSTCGNLNNIPTEDQEALDAAAPTPGDYVFECAYFDASFFSAGFNACVEYSYPEGEDFLNCDLLRQNALADDSQGCRAYDNVGAAYEYEALEALWNSTILSFAYDPSYVDEIDDLQTSDGFGLLESLCSDDPCELAPLGESCRVFTNETPEEEISDEAFEAMSYDEEVILQAILAGDSLSDFFGGGSVESFANCANETSAYGFYYCKDRHGDIVDCNPTW